MALAVTQDGEQLLLARLGGLTQLAVANVAFSFLQVNRRRELLSDTSDLVKKLRDWALNFLSERLPNH